MHVLAIVFLGSFLMLTLVYLGIRLGAFAYYKSKFQAEMHREHNFKSFKRRQGDK